MRERSPGEIASATAGGCADAMTKAEALVAWVYRNIRWSRTNHRRRSVEEVIQDGAGNCWDQSRVLSSLLDAAGVRWRHIAEINVEPVDLLRGAYAVWSVRNRGWRASVFGWRHNDHRWLEVALEDGRWAPADASLGICGERSWVLARLGFRDRPTRHISPARSMIAPLAIVASDDLDGALDLTEDYLMRAFNQTYGGSLARLNAWCNWTDAIRKACPLAAGALRGEVNLHRHARAVTGVGDAYLRLRSEALRAGARPL